MHVVRGKLDPDGSADGADLWALRVRYYDAGGVEIGGADTVYSGGADDESISLGWTEQDGYSITTPATAQTVRIELVVHAISGWVAFDDVALARQTSEKKYYYLRHEVF